MHTTLLAKTVNMEEEEEESSQSHNTTHHVRLDIRKFSKRIGRANVFPQIFFHIFYDTLSLFNGPLCIKQPSYAYDENLTIVL